MELKFGCVSSGSSGNCYFMEYGDRVVFVDVGVPLKSILACEGTDRFAEKEVHLFITHEHHDHISGLKPFINKFKPVIYASEGTAAAIDSVVDSKSGLFVLKGGKEYSIDGYSVNPFCISHDSAEPFGYRFTFGGRVAVFATDLGVATKEVENFTMCSDILILESNYEPELLKNSKYPAYLKNRIASQKGHLSNRDAMKLLGSVCSTGIGKVFLAHVSEENNDYSLLENYAAFCKKNYYLDTTVLKRDCPLTIICS